MEEFDVQCESCGEEFEADSDLAGEVVECPECGADILVSSPHEEGEYEEDDIDEVLEEVKPARKPRKEAKAREKRPSAKAGKGRGRKPRKGGGTTTKSNMPLLMGGAAAALVLIIVVVAVALSSSSTPSTNGDGDGEDEETSSSSTSSPKKTKVSKTKRKAYEKALSEAEGADDPSLWVEAGDLAEEAGLTDEAHSAWKQALDTKEGYKPALTRLGYKKFSRSADAEEYEIESPEAFQELDEHEGKWLAPEEYKRFRKRELDIIQSIKKQIEDRANDPYYDSAVQVERVLSKRKGLSSRVWQKKTDRPYLVFEDMGPKGGAATESSAATRKKLDEKLRHLKFLFNYLMKRWFSKAGLKLDDKTPLVVLSLQDRAAFDAMHQEMGMRIPRGALAYFHRMHKYIILYNGAFGDASLAAQTASQGVLFHEGVHQIVNGVLNAGKGFDSTDAVYLPYWLNEGIAEYVGSLELSDDSDAEGNDLYIPGSLNKMRLAEFYMALHPERSPIGKRLGIKHSYAVDVPRLLECHDRGSTVSAIAKMYDDPEEGTKASNIFGTGLPYYQGTFFFYFCYNYEGGKYGKRFDRFLASSFKGLYYEDNFKAAFSGVDLDKLSKEWFGYVEKLARENLRR